MEAGKREMNSNRVRKKEEKSQVERSRGRSKMDKVVIGEREDGGGGGGG